MKQFNGFVLALDVATTTGWCYGKPGAVPKFGHIRFGKGSRASAYREFRQWLDQFKTEKQIDLIVFESPALPMVMQGRTNLDTIKLLMGFCEHLEEWAYDRVELREANVAQVRQHFLGENPRSAIAKTKTVARCRQIGWNVETGDEGDAAALWSYQIGCLRPDIAIRQTPLFGGAK